MAEVTVPNAFGYKWGENGTVDAMDDSQYKTGWAFIGTTPPSVEQFNKVLQTIDEKANYINSRLIGNNRNAPFVSSSQTLTAAHVGCVVLAVGSTAYTITLPLAVNFPAGSRIRIFCTNIGRVTVARQGTDNIIAADSGVPSIVLDVGDSLDLVSEPGSGWFAIGGSAQLAYSESFGRNLSAAGYQKLPRDAAGRRWTKQWGTISATVTAGALSPRVMFPLTFPNVLGSIIMTPIGNNTALSFTVDNATLSTDGFNWRSNYTGLQGYSWEATGY